MIKSTFSTKLKPILGASPEVIKRIMAFSLSYQVNNKKIKS
jgi:hypothetical protein